LRIARVSAPLCVSQLRHNPRASSGGRHGSQEMIMDTTNKDAAFWIAGYTDNLFDVVGTDRLCFGVEF
jgi:hypothetical protein